MITTMSVVFYIFPLPVSVQGQAGWGFEQPGPVGGVPAIGRGWS